MIGMIIVDVIMGVLCLAMVAAAVVVTSVHYERKLARLRCEFESIAGRHAWEALMGLDPDQSDPGFERGALRRLALHVAHASGDAAP